MNNLDFEPSRGVRKLFLYTRKSPSTSYGGIILPGLFQTSHYFWDIMFFLAVVVGEIYGFAQIDAKTSHGSASLFLGMILLDFACAFFAQLFIGGVVKRKNLLVLEQDNAETVNLRNQIVKRQVFAYAFKVVIIGVAIFKIVTFYNLKWGTIDQEMLLMTFIYLIVAVIHVACTGYFGAYLVLKVALAYQTYKHVSTKKKSYAIQDFILSEPKEMKGKPFQGCEIKSGNNNHTLLLADDTWRLKTWGILDDDQLHSIIWKQNKDSETKREVALAGLAHQLEML